MRVLKVFIRKGNQHKDMLDQGRIMRVKSKVHSYISSSLCIEGLLMRQSLEDDNLLSCHLERIPKYYSSSVQKAHNCQ
jgi:hypothetical protein